ncbi:MAG: glycosyltransferase [Trueperaceae bacterium]|nr:glycosyltransferase [Trueperaceae bacterium]
MVAADEHTQEPLPGAVPELSVITVTHARLDLLRRKAEALSAQTLAPARFEWCVVVNGDAAAAAWLRASEFPFHVQVTELPENGPVAAGRNLAVATARGACLLLSDDDVLPSPDCLAAHLAAHAALGGRGAVIGDLRLSEELRVDGVTEPFEQRILQSGAGLWINVTGANSSLPRAVFQAIGGFDEAFAAYGGEDSDLGFRLRAAGMRFARSAAAWAVHVGRVLPDTAKAFAAGRAGVKVWRKHKAFETGVMLGVHPVLVAIKRIWLRSPARGLLSAERLAYELAYLDGARAELHSGARPKAEEARGE